ncbi:phosphoribosylformylglycinamidine cyclo-ligase [Candidatus Gottesmanbacteria bacterium]|nr:phosphoribosylformylglycinamidine cyclo-ligase [Candidatus Gottesmanbacteria bacterium]
MKQVSITYASVGDNYKEKDPLKVFTQKKAKSTRSAIRDTGVIEVTASRGESAYVIDLGQYYLASTQEGLGTKNLIADAMMALGGKKPYYEAMGIDTVATIVNDLITVGARPLVVNAHWSLGSNDWFSDKKKFKDLVKGWTKGCLMAGAVYGGGETPTLQGIVNPTAIELSGSAVGIIRPKKRLIVEENLKVGDAIVLIESSGIHTNGLSMARSLASKLPKGYKMKLPSGKFFGDALLTPSHIYVKLVEQLFLKRVDIHYLSHITGHGWRKIMRAKKVFTYRIYTVPPVQEEFTFIQKHGSLSTKDMYGIFNMGTAFACFVSPKDAETVVKAAASCSLKSFVAGVVEHGSRKVVIEPLGITFEGSSFAVK